MPRPFFPLAIALIAGIAFAGNYTIQDLPVLVGLAAALILLLLAGRQKGGRLFYPSLLLCLFLLGVLEMNLYLRDPPERGHVRSLAGEKKLTIEGMIAENPQVSPEKTELVVSVFRLLRDGEYIPVRGRVLLVSREPQSLHYGDVVRFHVRLRAPHNFNNPGGFDYERYLRFRGILVRGNIGDASGIVLIRRDKGNPLRAGLENIRDRIRETIALAAPGEEGRIIQALILGERKEIPKEVMENFNRTGTTHIIAISGLHIGIVALFALFVIRLILKSSEYLLLKGNMAKISAVFALLTVVLYTFIAGAGISVVRSALMIGVLMGAILLNRERDLFNTLALAAFIILIAAPYSLFDVSFQLSFAAVASLLFLTPRLTALLPPVQPGGPSVSARMLALLKRGLRGGAIYFFVSLSATLGTLPLILFYYNRLSLVSLAANLLVVPMLGSLAIPLCLLAVMAIPVSGGLAALIVRIAELPVGIALYLIDRFAAAPSAAVFVPTPTVLEIAAFYLLLISAGFCLDRPSEQERGSSAQKSALPWKAITVLMLFFLLGSGIHFHLQGQQKEKLSLTAVDVGQGSAVLVRFPGGKRMLVDGGGFYDESFDVGKSVLAPFLWRERIGRIDTVVLTHPHPDHLQGLLFILENFNVRDVWTNGEGSDTRLYGEFRRIVREKGITLRELSEQSPEMEISGVRIRILNPAGAPDKREQAVTPSLLEAKGKNPETGFSAGRSQTPGGWTLFTDESNERSLVIKITYGRSSFLLPADISEATEGRLVRTHADLGSDVLFVPHHGSGRSSSAPFLDKVRPRTAVLSCGPDNVFRLPHPDVLRRYERFGTRLHRTDRDGAVALETDGNDITVKVFRGRR